MGRKPDDSAGTTALVLALFVYAVAARGYLLECLWAWYVAPVFGLELLAWHEAAGLVLTYLTISKTTSSSPKVTGAWVWRIIAVPWLSLALAWAMKETIL